MLVFEVMGVNISSICKRMALTIEFLTPGTCTSHARIGKLAESEISNCNTKTRENLKGWLRYH